MHIPDGLMSPEVLAIGWMVTLPALALVMKRVKQTVDDRNIPAMGVVAAGIFMAQMLNFPIGGGTTGHLLGTALAAYLFGPYAAVLMLTTILIIQAFIFGDGGITALGLNILNMGLTGALIAGVLYRLPAKKEASLAVASWLAVFTGAFLCAAELAASYTLSGGVYGIPASISFPAMLSYHALIGVGEAVISVGVYSYLESTAPDLVEKFQQAWSGTSGTKAPAT